MLSLVNRQQIYTIKQLTIICDSSFFEHFNGVKALTVEQQSAPRILVQDFLQKNGLSNSPSSKNQRNLRWPYALLNFLL